MKFKRSERLVDMTMYISQHPYEKLSYSFFADRYQAAKSSLSEDVAILRETLKQQGLGHIETMTGVSGGFIYKPAIDRQTEERFIDEIIDLIEEDERILPGGYLYLTDILGSPQALRRVAHIIANRMMHQQVDVVMTVATKGIPLATVVGLALNCPVVYARKDSKVTEGASVSVKYTSASAPHVVQSMEISRNSLAKGSQVLLIDDFLRGGGTFEGLSALLEIFDCQAAAKFVLCENIQEGQQLDTEVQSLITVQGLDNEKQELEIKKGSFFS